MDRVYVMQLVRSFQVGQLSRRDFVRRATLALGSAAAANTLLAACTASPNASPSPVVDEAATAAATSTPAAAAAATESPTEEPTDAATEASADAPGLPAEGVAAEEASYDGPEGGTLQGYLARPEDADEPLPGVVVIQEWWGLNAHIEDVTRRFAAQGYVALAPDLYHGVVTTEPDEARKQVMELDMAQAVEEISAAADYLLARDDVRGETVGIVGYCMGGGLVLQTARADDTVGAAVAYYGRPLSPEEAAELQAPLQGHYGSEDDGIPVDEVRAMEDGLNEGGVTNEIYVYDGAGHAFFNETRDSYAPEAAQQAWSRTLDWFEQHLG